MNEDNVELNKCPNCGGRPLVHKRKGKYWIECGYDCWTQTRKHWDFTEAVSEWNSILPSVKDV